MRLFKCIFIEILGGINMEERYSVNDISNYFLSKEAMTPKKLQKILYFAYSWYLAMMNDTGEDLEFRLFNNHFEAWIHGPVCPDIYSRYKHKGGTYIDKYVGELPDIDNEDMDILEQVWEVYGEYSANELESITHQHDPWKITRKENGCSRFDWCNADIKDRLIFDYYAKQLEAE